MSASLGYGLFAGGLAALISFFELSNSRKKPLAFKASHFVLYRTLLDAAGAMGARALLVANVQHVPWFTGYWPAVAAAVAGPAILRSQFKVLKNQGGSAAYGIANVFTRFQKKFDEEIDDISSVAQSEWINRRALPALSAMSIDELSQHACDYLRSLDRITANKLKEHLDYIEGVVDDVKPDDDDKYRTIVKHLLENGGRRLVKSLVIKGEALGKSGSEPA